MMPDWITFDRMQILLVGVAIAAVALAIVCLAFARRPSLKLGAVVVFGAVAVGAAWQLHANEVARRTDCTRVEVFGSRVVVPACPDPRA